MRQLASKIEECWQTRGFENAVGLEAEAQTAGDPRPIRDAALRLAHASLSAAQVDEFWVARGECRTKIETKLGILQARRTELEKKLPPSLVAINSAVGAAKQLKESWDAVARLENEIATIDAEKARIEQVRSFLDTASATFQRLRIYRQPSGVWPLFSQSAAPCLHRLSSPTLSRRS